MPQSPTTLCTRAQGSCGFGILDKVTYPYFAAAALSTSNSFFKAGPVNGCGQCFQIQVGAQAAS